MYRCGARSDGLRLRHVQVGLEPGDRFREFIGFICFILSVQPVVYGRVVHVVDGKECTAYAV